MMRLGILTVCVLILGGCSLMAPGENEAPVASIVSISPPEASEGETVSFSGEGTDMDGEVVGYLWQSDLDGELSRSSSFATNSLSVGPHEIEFSVQDNNGAWSGKARGTVRIVAGQAPVASFSATSSSITVGQSASLSWNVSNAASVTIDQGIGAVEPVGSLEVTPETTTTYTLTAQGDSSTATATVTITVQEGANTVTLSADSELSGYIRRSGDYRNIGIYIGDDDANRGIQGFLTFDISEIPEDATITRVVLDLSTYDLPYGPPFPGLGCLGAYPHEYDSLYNQYYEGDLPTPVEEWCEFVQLDFPMDSAGLRDALQDELGEDRFQLRLQFPGIATDGDETRDMLHWDRNALPTLTVEYDE